MLCTQRQASRPQPAAATDHSQTCSDIRQVLIIITKSYKTKAADLWEMSQVLQQYRGLQWAAVILALAHNPQNKAICPHPQKD